MLPGLAVAHELRRVEETARVVFLCSAREIDRLILRDEPFGMVTQPIRPAPARKRDVIGFVRALRASRRIARRAISRANPRAVLGLGGFAAWPGVRFAAHAGYRTGMLNPDVAPGKANRRLAPDVAAIFSQFEATADYFADVAPGLVQVTGCPVRSELIAGDRDEAIRAFGLDGSRKTLLVFGGSQAASTLNEALPLLTRQLGQAVEQWQVLAIVGEGFTPAGPIDDPAQAAMPLRYLPYCHRMELAYAVADLTLCRAGASTMAELAATGTPAVLVPYPYHADDHQRLNAEAFQAAGAGLICTDATEAATNVATLKQVLLPLLKDAGRLASMAAAAAELAQPNAARLVAEWLAAGSVATGESDAKENPQREAITLK